MEKTIHLDKDKFAEVKSGKKKFEVRLGNEDINKGDVLIIREKGDDRNPTGKQIIRKAGHIEITKNMPYYSKEDKNKLGFKIIQLE